MTDKNLILSYECLSDFRKPIINSVLNAIDIPPGSSGLDAACGIGSFTEMLAEKTGPGGDVTGLDITVSLIEYARKAGRRSNTTFDVGDINALEYDDEIFDWIWSVDTVWPGPAELGCPAEEPYGILKEFHRVLKPGAKVYLLFYTSQKFLPGYPILESRLNSSLPANAPFTPEAKPVFHCMNAGQWLKTAGFTEIKSETFVHHISAPLEEKTGKALSFLINMLWGEAKEVCSKEEWDLFRRLSDLKTEECILKKEFYTGFYTYTLFEGKRR